MGASFDDPDENRAFAEEEGFQYELWSDTDRVLAMYYGAAANESAFVADRITMLMDGDGVLVLEYIDDIQVGTHPALVLEDCEKLFGE